MLHKSRFTSLALVLAAAILLMSQPAAAATPQTALPAGTTIYSVASSTTVVTTSSTTPVDLAGAATSVTIPTGQKGDVMVFFCAESRSKSITVVRARISITTLKPGAIGFRETTTAYLPQTQCANFHQLNVGEGTWTVRMQWYATPLFGPAVQEIGRRTLTVIVNLH